MNPVKLYCILVFLLLGSTGSYGQKIFKGLVLDAGTLEPLPYVSVKIKNYNRGTTSNDLGDFAIQATMFDTLVFSCIGYSPEEFPIKNSDESIIIRMIEAANVLKTITVYNSVSPGFKNIPVESRWKNQSAVQGYGYGILQTFGPGYTFKSPISGLLKSEKEKKRLTALQHENSKSKDYVEIVNDPEVKDELKKKYLLTDEKYYDILARFNQANKKSMYGLDRKSLIFSLFHFFESDMNKRNSLPKTK